MAPHGQTVALIAAMAKNRVIGRRGSIPWHLPHDLRRFRELTMGHPVIVGRKTYESIGHALPGRTMVVLTRQEGFSFPHCLVARDFASALRMVADAPMVFVAGGGEVYREALTFADRIYLTLVPFAVEGDAFFPEMPAQFQEVAREIVPGEPPLPLVTYERRGRR